jgi:NH3-dependent NAD+ synthetase
MLLASEKLPKLRHFEFSDYRALTRNGEALHELCTRLFGQTCTPELLPNELHMKDEDARGWDNLNVCLRNLLQLPQAWNHSPSVEVTSNPGVRSIQRSFHYSNWARNSSATMTNGAGFLDRFGTSHYLSNSSSWMAWMRMN